MKTLLIIFCFLFSIQAIGQKTRNRYLSFTDLVAFWKSYDQVVLIKDNTKQLKIIQSDYLNKAIEETRFIQHIFHYSAANYLDNIYADPEFWKGLRERSRILMIRQKEIVNALKKLASLSNHIFIPQINFMVGNFEFGGRTGLSGVMIAVEVALADGNLDSSTYNTNHEVNESYIVDAAIYYSLHESVHINQQRALVKQNLLSLSIMEGSCDFITELALGKPLERPYIVSGNKAESLIWTSFKKQMNDYESGEWLYNNGNSNKKNEDLGYFVGYAICKSYYENAVKKKEAIRKIIGLNFNSEKDIRKFLLESGYEDKIRKKY